MTHSPITIAPDVARMIGPDIVRAIRSGRQLATGICPTCRNSVDRQHQDAVVVVRVVEIDTGTAAHVNLAHAACSDSLITSLTAEQVDAESGDDGLGECTMLTTLALPGCRPVVLVRFGMTHRLMTSTGDGVDLVAQILLSAGWHLVTHWEADPPGVPGWRLHWHPTTTAAETGPAQVSITSPDDELLADATLSATRQWHQAASAAEAVAVYYTPLPLHTWTDGVDEVALTEAIRDGQVIGARLSVSLRRQA